MEAHCQPAIITEAYRYLSTETPHEIIESARMFENRH